jgi:transcription elongation factor Elf1
MTTIEPERKSKSLLTSLITCVACNRPMSIERSDPDAKGHAVVQYRCGCCGHSEQLLFRR